MAAEEAELEVSDSLADLAMIVRAVATSAEWTYPLPPNAVNAPLRIRLANRWIGGWPREEWRARLTGWQSPAFRNLSQLWIVATFTQWEEVHRKRIVAAGGSGAVDIFGDLRHLRNDIVHHAGIATLANAGKCKVLKDFTSGHPIFLSQEDLEVILDELAAWVVSLGGTSHGRVHRDPEVRHT